MNSDETNERVHEEGGDPERVLLHRRYLTTGGQQSLRAFLVLVDVIIDEVGQTVKYRVKDPLAVYTNELGALRWPLHQQLDLVVFWELWSDRQRERFRDILLVRREIMSHGQAPVKLAGLDALTVELAGLLVPLHSHNREFRWGITRDPA